MRRILVATVVVSLAVLVALLALRAGFQRERLRVLLETASSVALDQPVAIGELRGPLWPAFELVGVRVGPPARPLLVVPGIDVIVGGPTFAPTLGWRVESVRLHAPSVRLASGADEHAHTEGKGDLRRPARPATLDLPVMLADLDVRDLRIEWSPRDTQTVRWEGRVTLGDLALGDGLQGVVGARGSLDLEVVEDPTQTSIFRSGRVHAELDRGAMRIDPLEAEGAAGRISGKGEVDVAGWLARDPRAELRLSVELAGLDLASLTGRPELASGLAGRGELWLKGPGANRVPTAGRLDVEFEPSSSPLGEIENGRARLAWQDATVDLEQLALRGAGLEINAVGQYASGRVDGLEVEGRWEALGPPPSWLPVTAQNLPESIRGRAKLEGPLDRLEGSIDLEARGLSWGTGTWPRAVASLRAEGDEGFLVQALRLEGDPSIAAEPGGRFRLGPQRVEIDALALRSEGARLELAGRFDADGVDDLELRVAGLDLARVPGDWLVEDLRRGTIEADLVFDGPYRSPSTTGRIGWLDAGTGSLPADDVRLMISPEGDRHRLAAEIRSQGRRWLVGHAVVRRLIPEAGLSALRSGLRFEAELDRADLAKLEAFAPAWLARIEGFASGRVEGRFEGVDHVPLLAGRITLDDGAATIAEGDGRIAGARGVLEFAGDELQVSLLHFDWITPGAERPARIRAEGRLGRNGFVDVFRVDTERMDAALLGPVLSPAVSIAGPLEGHLALEGSYLRPRVEGQVLWREPAIGDLRADALWIAATSEGEGVTLAGELEVGGRTPIVLAGTLPRGLELGSAAESRTLQDRGFFVSLKADRFDVGFLAPLARGAIRNPQGRASGFVEVRGSPDGPVVLGDLSLIDGGFRVPAFATTFTPISSRVRLDSEALHVADVTIGGEQGEARLTGVVRHRNLRLTEADLALVADRFLLSRPRLFRTLVTGRARLHGAAGALVLVGNASLDELDVEIPRTQDPAMKEIRILAERVEADAEVPDPTAGMAIRLRIDVPAESRIHGLGADLRVEGSVAVDKNRAEEAAYAGGLRVMRGTYLFQGRRFEVTRGSARLDGSAEPDPVLDVEASHTIRDVTIVALLSGRMSDPIVKLTSEPPMPDDDVLSYVLFGRPSAQLTDTGQGFVGDAAGQLAKGVVSSKLGELTQGFLHVDSIDVSTDGETPVLGVGKTLNDRTFVRIGKSLGVPAEDEIHVEVRITPQISVQSEITTRGNAGGDVVWKLDY